MAPDVTYDAMAVEIMLSTRTQKQKQEALLALLRRAREGSGQLCPFCGASTTETDCTGTVFRCCRCDEQWGE